MGATPMGGVPGAVPPPPAAPGMSASNFYEASWAVLIGINEYVHPGIPNLECAVADVEAVASTLTQVGFDPSRIVVLENQAASRQNIQTVLGGQMAQMTGPEDRLMVFFSGHGQDCPDAQGNAMGYLIPMDGDPEQMFASCISMDDVKRWNKMIPAKHILYVMDCCYSGLAATRSSGLSPQHRNWLQKVTSEPVRQIVTAGRGDQKVFEENGQGVFTRELLKALRGGADLQGRGFITGQELGTYLRTRVFEASDEQQDPQFRYLSGDGEFLFLNPELATSPIGVAPPRPVPPPVAATPPPVPPPVSPPVSPPRRAPSTPTRLRPGPGGTSVLDEGALTQLLHGLEINWVSWHVQPDLFLSPKEQGKLKRDYQIPDQEPIVAYLSNYEKTGMVFTTWGVYWLNGEYAEDQGPGVLRYEDFPGAEFRETTRGGCAVDLHGVFVEYTNTEAPPHGVRALQAIQEYVAGGAVVDRVYPTEDVTIPVPTIVELLAEFPEVSIYRDPAIPTRKLRNGRRSYGIPPDEEVAVLIDGTVFGSAKEGFAFCTRGVYWFWHKSLGPSPGMQHVPYSWFPQCEFQLAPESFKGVQLTYKHFCTVTGVEREIFRRMLERIREYIMSRHP